MNHFGKAIVAGFIATLVLSALMVMKSMMGIMPELDLPRMLSRMVGADALAAGWLVHFIIGTFGYGIALALLHRHLPGDSEVGHGVFLAFLGWLLMMVLLMPMVGAGFFAMNMGLMTAIMTLVLHLIFGAVLGWWFGRSIAKESPRDMARV